MNPNSGANASLKWSNDSHSGSPSAHVSVFALPAARGDGAVDLHFDVLSLVRGQRYTLSFWARAENSGDDARVVVEIRRLQGNWENYGLQQVQLRPQLYHSMPETRTTRPCSHSKLHFSCE